MLPRNVTIPDNATMEKYYPDIKLKPGEHPFMLSYCNCKNIHDVYTNINFPEQEELTFIFPVIYTDENGARHMCSYLPVLYLDSLPGVIGGLLYGLRKQFHPQMKTGEPSAFSRWWSVKGVTEASFIQTEEEMETLPVFIEQTFNNPFVTLSYPLPYPLLVFYQVRVYPDTVRNADGTFEWNYKRTTVRDSEDTWSVYTEYLFTMSNPMYGKKYFY
jgi:hypothetical protein